MTLNMLSCSSVQTKRQGVFSFCDQTRSLGCRGRGVCPTAYIQSLLGFYWILVALTTETKGAPQVKQAFARRSIYTAASLE